MAVTEEPHGLCYNEQANSRYGGGRMVICGFQKLTLLDFPGRVAATVFTGGCNLRCPFCHNATLVTDTAETPILATDEVLAYLKRRHGVLDGVCVTGGEPTLQPDLPAFLGELKAMGYAVKLDTNGTNPALLRSLLADGLVDYVAMDIKNCREKYGITAGKIPFDIAPIEQSISLLLRGSTPYEFRTTVVKGIHTQADLVAIGDLIGGAERYVLQGFVDSGALIGGGFEAFTPEEMKAFLAAVLPRIPTAQLRGID